MILRRSTVLAVLSTLLALTPAGAQSERLHNIGPSRHFAPPDTSLDELAAAIRGAAHDRGWRIDSERPGESIASILVRGKHHAVVRIGYDESRFWIDYVSSENLDYSEKGEQSVLRRGPPVPGPRIHRSYNGWVAKLANAILSATREPPDPEKSEETSGNEPLLVADELQKLHSLVESGALTQEEYDRQKQKLLGH